MVMIDKTLLFDGGSIGWLFWLVNGYFALDMDILRLFYIEKQGLAMRLEEGGGAAAALLGNHCQEKSSTFSNPCNLFSTGSCPYPRSL
jgi:hypothetical protein